MDKDTIFSIDEIQRAHEIIASENDDNEDQKLTNAAHDLSVSRHGAVDDVAKANFVEIFRSLNFVSRKEYLRRISKCKLCPHRQAFTGPGSEVGGIILCGQCGCIMNAKARLQGGVCPIGLFK